MEVDWVSSIGGAVSAALPVFERLSIVRAILGALLVLFIPGFAWTFVLFHKLTLVERIAFSVGLSVALVALSLLFANYVLHIGITGTNAALVILAATALAIAVRYVPRWFRPRGQTNPNDPDRRA